MTPAQFIAKWRRTTLSERSAAQQHFLDLCELVEHDKPAAVDAAGDEFTFEKGAVKVGGGDGWADVWKRGFFGWEYKGKHRDLKAAYGQLLQYREALDNPPLLVVCDFNRIQIHTNFTSSQKRVYEIPLEEMGRPEHLETLRRLFFEPDKLNPAVAALAVTEEAARQIADLAERMRGRGLEATQVARFVDRLVFCLFAQNVSLLPAGLFTRMLEQHLQRPDDFRQVCASLMQAMAVGAFYGEHRIRHFNGHLFEDAEVLPLDTDELRLLRAAARLDWSALEPSIFGTLFERGLDPARRSQLGAHYTSRADIETLVEPVVMQPLRREWDEVRTLVRNLRETGVKHPTGKEKKPGKDARAKALREADMLLDAFHTRLQNVKVLDPACGSGNFLYVTLQLLMDLENEVITFAQELGTNGLIPLVGPWQLYGIEVSPYAFELAQMTVWIGYLQWKHSHQYGITDSPVLRPMDANFRRMDAILDLSDPQHPREPEWPRVDYVVGNPPFLGGKLLRRELGDDYVDRLFQLWRKEVPPEADLCCYWFEKARRQIESRGCRRAGLLATQGIRGGANREVLRRIKETGDIFFAVSDRDWVLDGANVHISLIGFDDRAETQRDLDGATVAEIPSNLAVSGGDTTQARAFPSTRAACYMGDTKGGAFDLAWEVAAEWLRLPNVNGRPNSDVLLPSANGWDVTRRHRGRFIIDFGTELSVEEVSLFEAPYAHVAARVRPERELNRRPHYRQYWWRHLEPRPSLTSYARDVDRLLCTPRVSKHRVFLWLPTPTLPDCQLFAFTTNADDLFGVLQARGHEVWALRQGTRLETRPRYTPTTCFETFPFPEPTEGQREAIGKAARELDRLRNAWLNPPEWVREEVLEFPGALDGPWARYVRDPDARGIGTVRYPRLVPRDDEAAVKLAKRTLTHLYNERPAWLDECHRRLDAAVFAAYGWPAGLSDEDILRRLLALNLERAGPAGDP